MPTITFPKFISTQRTYPGGVETFAPIDAVFELGDSTIQIAGGTTNTANLPVDTPTGVTIELTDAEHVAGAVVHIIDQDAEWIGYSSFITACIPQEDFDALELLLDKYVRPNRCGLSST